MRFLVLLLSVAVTGCTVGPDFVRPEPPVPETFDAAEGDFVEAGEQTGSELWRALEDPALDALIGRALAENRGLAQALARLDEARALRGLETWNTWPIVTANLGGERFRPSTADPFIPPGVPRTDVYRAGFDAAWEIDLFGRQRRTREALDAELVAATDDYAALRLSTIAETAQAYFTFRAEEQRLEVQMRQIRNLQTSIGLLETLRDEGRGTELDVARSNALGLEVASAVPLTREAIVRQEQRLAVLTALPLADVRATLNQSEGLPTLPDLVTVGQPLDWLQRRPDVSAAEARLAAATAQVGVATADFYPRLDLFGSFGWTAMEFSDLGSSDADRYSFGPTLSWTFLDYNRVRERVRANEARAAGALAAFDETILLALEETESALAAWRASNQSAALLDQAVKRADDALELARLSFREGAVDSLAVLDAERTKLNLETSQVSAAARRATALAALYKALAGDFAAAP
ncbi:MAG: efflux transporter outer membrane subunit [Pseudomonadota bacterium]